ncbi:hypothetical protein GALMADRAFT_1127086 [Galerina marginata CBS 339.88]|uniref:Uncharacterized protein n=1 Tax=Galerina marginata (strain CBS 339.88) TaxID=685588 RepID=A0A067SBD6_GALM3|nr:hypothetical protein GALMADRAFT_1127086 [Galerina marginata CBS 339.88]
MDGGPRTRTMSISCVFLALWSFFLCIYAPFRSTVILFFLFVTLNLTANANPGTISQYHVHIRPFSSSRCHFRLRRHCSW